MKSVASNPAETAITLADPETVVDLRRTNEQLRARIAELERPAPRWSPLKAAAGECGLDYEWVRKHAVRGLIEARREGGRWLVNVTSLKHRFSRSPQ